MQRSWPGRETTLRVRRTVVGVEVGAEREVGVRYSREVKGRRLLEVREEKRLPNATAFPPAEHAIHQCAQDAPANAAAADGHAPLQAPANLRRAVVPALPNHPRHRDDHAKNQSVPSALMSTGTIAPKEHEKAPEMSLISTELARKKSSTSQN